MSNLLGNITIGGAAVLLILLVGAVGFIWYKIAAYRESKR